MAEYIDRDTLKAELEKINPVDFGSYMNWEIHRGASDALRVVDYTVDEAPAADVVPVRHGHWVKSDIPNVEFRCSECGGACWYYNCGGAVTKSKYCPNCGARME